MLEGLRKLKKTAFAILAILVLAGSLSGCDTAEEAGDEIQEAGDEIEDTLD